MNDPRQKARTEFALALANLLTRFANASDRGGHMAPPAVEGVTDAIIGSAASLVLTGTGKPATKENIQMVAKAMFDAALFAAGKIHQFREYPVAPDGSQKT